MSPVKFKESNFTYAEDQKEYLPLPSLRYDTAQGHVVTCWRLTFRERLRVLFTGNLWLQQLTFNNPLQPLYPTTIKGEVVAKPSKKKD